MAQEERVLVVERQVLEQAGMFEGITLDVERYLSALFAPGAARFIPRPAAEDDPSFKQLIPYVVLSCNGRYLSYVRGKRSGESRLVGRRSIGIGGHVNPSDDLPLFNNDFRDAYLAAVDREVAEEVAVEANHTDSIVALLNDESTPVGKVHLGIVHLWTLDAPNVVKREQMITQMAFTTAAELQQMRESLESWSLYCLDHLDAIVAQANSRECKGQTATGPFS